MKKNTDYPKWKIFLDLGKRNLKLNQNISANNALSKSISIKQDNYLSFYYRGQARHRLKNYTLAIKDLTKSLEIKKDFYTYIQRGISYYETNKYDDSLDDYNFAYKLFCKNSKIKYANQLFFHRGVTLYVLKKHQQSVYDFSKAIKLGLDSFAVFQNRGFGYFHLQKLDNALLDFKEAIKRNPDNENQLTCYEQLCLINIKLKNFEEVEKYAKKGFVLSKKNNWNGESTLTLAEREKINKCWLLFLGFSNIKLNNFKKAEYWLKQVNFGYMDRPHIRIGEYICRAFTLTHLDKYEKALEYIDRAFRHKRIFGWNFIFSEIDDLIIEFPIEMKNIISIKYQYKFNK